MSNTPTLGAQTHAHNPLPQRPPGRPVFGRKALALAVRLRLLGPGAECPPALRAVLTFPEPSMASWGLRAGKGSGVAQHWFPPHFPEGAEAGRAREGWGHFGPGPPLRHRSGRAHRFKATGRSRASPANVPVCGSSAVQEQREKLLMEDDD
ncbi:unnamed protein product [Prorocentrum cordatum]|uniref:Uncharacterized protein n=1 Tax=Prorocentrum cordatum TaxID=2364126 RepID=A0ABN9QVS7_9DINO|nr:unnamed protein product [Polarella glacialis]